MSELAVAIVSPGAMGAAVGARLHANGIRVVTPPGRSEASLARARAAGIDVVSDAELGRVDFVFCIVPPAEALAVAERWAPVVGSGGGAPLYIDWNAISPAKAKKIADIISAAGGRAADGCILGPVPAKEGAGPLLLASGEYAPELARLQQRGLRFKVLPRSIGVASAVKMSYAGITKGTIALGTAMLLAAHRAGCGEELVAELAASQAPVWAAFQKSIPDMFDKAGRWVAEIREIAAYVGGDQVESALYAEMAEFYRVLAEDMHHPRVLASILSDLLRQR